MRERPISQSVASWHAAQKPGHVFSSHASIGCVGGGSRFGNARTIFYGFGWPTWLLWFCAPGSTAAYAGPSSAGQGCRLLAIASSAEVPDAADPPSEIGPGAGHLVADTVKPSELERSSAFHFPSPEAAGWCLGCSMLDVLALLDASAVLLFFATVAFLGSCKRTGESSQVEMSWRKSNSLASAVHLQARGTLLLQLPLQYTHVTEVVRQ